MVEDHEDSRAGLALWLEIVGHAVEASGDGLSALAVARARPPAIAIIDIGLPGLNGWEVATRLREEFGRHIGLIALTSLRAAEDRAHSVRAGFDVHLVKPATGEELFARSTCCPRPDRRRPARGRASVRPARYAYVPPAALGSAASRASMTSASSPVSK